MSLALPEPATDEQRGLLNLLASRRSEEADAAVARIWRQGAAMAPLLLTLRGRTEPFAGRSLLNPRASMVLPLVRAGIELPPSERHRVVTVEAAALYLSCALMRGELHFSQVPLLVDPSEPRGKRVVANTPERLARAFDAAEAWARGSRAAPGSRAQDPIAASGLYWY